ncbi:SAC domain-containing protein [Aphelenchoides bicaudatus]|nr:SAC domain-containing protein [Aphelenchoides bicaudatus]
MQLLSTAASYYIKSVRTILKIDRRTSRIDIVTHAELAELDDWHILYNNVYGFIGKLVVDELSFFLVILDAEEVGVFGKEPVYRIKKALAVPIIDDGVERPTYFDALSNHFDKLKSQQKRLFNFLTNRGLSSMKLAEDVVSLINDLGTFYFCKSLDLTLTMQRRALDSSEAIDEFWWNRNLLDDLIESDGKAKENASEWVLHIIHGYFDQRSLSYEDTSQLHLTLISRRSVNRAGVRYLRRGVDADGNVANFVQTEMIISFGDHSLSFVQIRGSIPTFWSQSGFKYRPPPIIDKPLNESLPAFKKHFQSLETIYGSPILVINLVDSTGREEKLGESFKQHILELGMENVLYYPFDFHASSKTNGDQTSVLIDSMSSELQKIGFCWIDKTGQIVREQRGIIRTNCIDCLDRTNFVQSAISRSIVSVQALKLGLIEPFIDTPEILIQLLTSMWTAHGDCLSRQYSGTDALRKNEKTTRHRQKFFGLMKNGINSAKRYTNAHIKDYKRQLAIDLLVSGKATTTAMKTDEQMAEMVATEAQSNSGSTESGSSDEESNKEKTAGNSRIVGETSL